MLHGGATPPYVEHHPSYIAPKNQMCWVGRGAPVIAAHLTAVVSPLHVLIACDTFALPGDFILLVRTLRGRAFVFCN